MKLRKKVAHLHRNCCPKTSTVCMLRIFSFFFCCLMIFSQLMFSKMFSRNIIGLSNSLDPDQAQHFVGPDLGPNCLQRCQQTAVAGRELT